MLSKEEYLESKKQKEGKDMKGKVNIRVAHFNICSRRTRILAFSSKASGGFGTPDQILELRESQIGNSSLTTNQWRLRPNTMSGSIVGRKRSFPELWSASIG